ncbi:MAG: peptidoglycan DD-metalloendopeptidase family protein [Pseudomonadota bacterium]
MDKKTIRTSVAGLCATVIASASFALMETTSGFQEKVHKEVRKSAIVIQPDFEHELLPDTTPAMPAANWREHEIRSGENLSVIFSKLGLSNQTLHEIIRTNELGKELASLKPGNLIKISTFDDLTLNKLIYEKSAVESLKVSKTDAGYRIKKITKDIEKQAAYAQATIDSSFYLDAKEQGLPDRLIMKLTDIFAWDVDFAQDIRQGDQFTVLYDKHIVEGEEINDGDILAAEFINRGNVYRSVRYQDQKGTVDYYTPEGKTMRKAFLRSPVDFARISSHFNLKRKHPVLNRIRAHRGVDYAARTGTPVRATGDGKISFRGRKGGYGKVVIVQHDKSNSTLYAHLSRFNGAARLGGRVRQGQAIGYVGMTGLATGPHLHYEFQVNGVHKDPLKVKVVQPVQIDSKLLADFRAATQPLLSRLETVKTTLVAQAEL